MASPARVSMRSLAAVLWPSFLGAGMIEMGVFAMVDPGELHWLSGLAVEASLQAIYTVSFLVLWATTAAACALTALFITQPPESAGT
jgi:hypothetical protein